MLTTKPAISKDGSVLWSYKQVSESTANTITSLMSQAKADTDTHSKNLYRHWAYGAYLTWEHLTLGWRENGDAEEMKALLDD